MSKRRRIFILATVTLGCITILPACDGLFEGVYDKPGDNGGEAASGQLHIDATAWDEWHYIDLRRVETANADNLWQTFKVPAAEGNETAVHPDTETTGIYTYWYDVYGEGISRHEFRSFQQTAQQGEPEEWTIAVYRDNVRTNGCGVHATGYTSIDQLPTSREYLEQLSYTPDSWNETDVWTERDKMLSGIIGCQGISINTVLSSWLAVEIPPMPPTYSMDSRVYVLRLDDGTYAALQLADYMNSEGVKCHLTINYKYPL